LPENVIEEFERGRAIGLHGVLINITKKECKE
jgi:hypothetical protein